MHRFLSHAEFKYFSHGCMKNLTWRLEGGGCGFGGWRTAPLEVCGVAYRSP